ncbi:MAG: prolipoprotein diacylglyceryl transferase [Alphaproteobacteria bacterium]|nr:prolipoprotein diacylglyceryl transferase [Alphaproteobacteria bacterium]
MSLPFPQIDPVMLSFGPIEIRWYAMAYVLGFVFAWWRCQVLARRTALPPEAKDYDDFVSWGVIGTILGGRIGYVAFYQPGYYWANPLEALQVWHGGMSFHGGMMGVILAAYLFSKARKIPFFAFTDILACVVPVGLFLGRLANFINGELFGRVTDSPLGMIFPRGGELPRHPSQLYEAALEGLVLYFILYFLSRRDAVMRRNGVLSGTFLAGYSVFRFIVEFFREPDAQLGFLYGGATMGQLLCIPMFLTGLGIVAYALRKPRAVA